MRFSSTEKRYIGIVKHGNSNTLLWNEGYRRIVKIELGTLSPAQ